MAKKTKFVPFANCDACEEAKPLAIKLTLTDANGVLLDYVELCRDCRDSAYAIRDGKRLEVCSRYDL